MRNLGAIFGRASVQFRGGRMRKAESFSPLEPAARTSSLRLSLPLLTVCGFLPEAAPYRRQRIGAAAAGGIAKLASAPAAAMTAVISASRGSAAICTLILRA